MKIYILSVVSHVNTTSRHALLSSFFFPWSSMFLLTLLILGSSRIPVIGGKELNLHRLFVEVTSRGGFGKVMLMFYIDLSRKLNNLLKKWIGLQLLLLMVETNLQVRSDKRWKEITAIFSFPSSATNASFILKKYYASLLQHYEQIYYFKAKGWIPSAGSYR